MSHDGEAVANGKMITQVIGPSGNLRAPTLKVGNSFVVGFNEELYEDFF